MLGVNESLRNHYKVLAKKNWDMQREALFDPICDIKTKVSTPTNPALPSYLDNKDSFTLQQKIPVLPKIIKYRDTKGKLTIDHGLYFIFLENVIINKDDIILFEGSAYVVETFNVDTNCGLLQVEGRLP